MLIDIIISIFSLKITKVKHPEENWFQVIAGTTILQFKIELKVVSQHSEE